MKSKTDSIGSTAITITVDFVVDNNSFSWILAPQLLLFVLKCTTFHLICYDIVQNPFQFVQIYYTHHWDETNEDNFIVRHKLLKMRSERGTKRLK